MSNSQFQKLTVEDIRYGSYFDYDLIQWKAVGEHNYRWEDGTFSREFKMSGNGETRYLEVEDQEEELRVVVTRKIRVGAIYENVSHHIINNNKAPQTLTYHNKKFHLREDAAGEFRDLYGDNEWEHFEVWDYFDSSGKNMLSVERWEGNELEAFVGKIVAPDEFTNIKPGKSGPSQAAGWIGRNIFWIIFVGFFVGQFTVCNNNNSGNYAYSQPSYSVPQEGLSLAISEYDYHPDFTILLNDMTYQNKKYYHKYEILYPEGEDIKSEITEWKLVSPQFFRSHKDHMGLELATQKDNVVNKVVAPPGFSHYVGNEQYGSWESQSDGTRVWRFLARYAVLNAVLNSAFGAPRYNTWSQYDSGYRGRNFFGPAGRYTTQKYLLSGRGKSSQWGLLPANVRQEVEEEYYGSSSRRSRSGNRYSSRSSRSRSGGGK